MDRQYYVFRNTLLMKRHLTIGGAIKTAKQLQGDIRVVSAKSNQVVWTNKGA